MDNNYDELKEELKKQALDNELKANGLVVPDFDSMIEFRNWANDFDDNVVRQFSKKDWLKIYDKIEDFLKNNKNFDNLYQENKTDFMKNSGINVSPEALKNPEIDLALKRIYFMEGEGGRGLCLLNRNFTFEENDFQLIRKLGREAGQIYAEHNSIQTPLELGIKTKLNGTDKLLNETRRMNDIVVAQTAYYDKLFEGKYPFSKVVLDENMVHNGLAEMYNNSFGLKLNPHKVREDAIHIGFHEGAHLHMQASHVRQAQLLTEGIKAVEGFDDDFYKLMQMNSLYYVSQQRAIRDLNPDLANYLTPNQMYSLSLRHHNSYHKQPKEKFSELYGIEAERTYRRITKNYSERNAFLLNGVIKGLPMVGEPEYILKTEKGINLYYKSENLSPEMMEKTIKDRLANADDDFVEALNIEKTFDGCVKLEASSDWEFGKNLKKFMKTPAPLPPMPSLSNEELKEKSAEDKGMNSKNAKSNLEVEKNQRVEKAKRKISKIIADNDANSMFDVGNDKLSLLVNEKSLAIHEAFAGIDNTEEIGDLRESARQSIERMEERLKVKNVKEKAVKSKPEEKVKKNNIYSKAKEANDKFDNAIDRIIDKGSKKLNNTKVGKAYQKLENKVLDSKVVKETQSFGDKVLTWGKNKLGNVFKSKAGKKAVSKAGTKAVSKIGGKAVVKSVVKKIPLVSVVAGVGFGVERCFKGEWAQAGGEVLSGVLGCFPGLGTAASVAVDAGLAASDIYKENKSKKEDVKPEVDVGKVSGKVVKEIAERGEMLREQGRSEHGYKGEVRETKLSAEQMVAISGTQRS